MSDLLSRILLQIFLFLGPKLTLLFESRKLLDGYKRQSVGIMSKEIKLASYSFFKEKSYKLASGSNSMYSFLYKMRV